jgi:hypothetical protein
VGKQQKNRFLLATAQRINLAQISSNIGEPNWRFDVESVSQEEASAEDSTGGNSGTDNSKSYDFNFSEKQRKQIKKKILEVIPALAAAGAAVGSTFGPVGTAIGGAIGAAIGAIGYFFCR